MEQLTQNLKDGAMQLLEVPFPVLSRGCVLVRNHYSLISAGTEGKTVKDARLGYLGKARARKEDVKKVMDAARTYGVVNTYRMVMNKLDAPSALGYSCAGEVIAVADDVTEFRVGDRVACGGNTAVHAEVISVPVNLCVDINNAEVKQAAFTTLGAVALQGIRQADLRLGENCVVIGLGLVGQLTLQMLHAGGIKAIGIDTDPAMVELANRCGSVAHLREREDLEAIVSEHTRGHGTDAVIITAGTDSHDPVDLAGALCRKKGKVIIVGAVPTGFKRTNYFRKELDLRMSCSYGPGRYDAEYEEQGLDYPYAYVRWTERRNMQAFIEMLHDGRLQLAPLISHVFDFSEAPRAYDLILGKSEPYAGILLKYNLLKEIRASVVMEPQRSYSPGEVNIGLIGAGSFAQNFLLPALAGQGNFVGVVTSKPNNSRNIAGKYKFGFASGNASELFANRDINTIFVASRHDSHAQYVLDALKHEKNVFVEKPLCLTEEELHHIANAYVKGNVRLMVGFNRRFAPLVTRLKGLLPEGPLAIHIRVNAGSVAADHWTQHPLTGGGRILGEACHFIDLAAFLAGSRIQRVSAMALDSGQRLNDTVTVNMQFENGSIANVSYFSNGNKLVEKESIEVFGAGTIARLMDFRELQVFGKSEKKFSSAQDKGHKQELEAFCGAIKNGTPSPIAFDDIYASMLATFKVLESLAQNGREIQI